MVCEGKKVAKSRKVRKSKSLKSPKKDKNGLDVLIIIGLLFIGSHFECEMFLDDVAVDYYQ